MQCQAGTGPSQEKNLFDDKYGNIEVLLGTESLANASCLLNKSSQKKKNPSYKLHLLRGKEQ